MTFVFALLLAIPASFSSCNHTGARNSPSLHVGDSIIANGGKLASIYCGSCHMLPDPSLLDKKTWRQSVLPLMGPHLGIFQYNFKNYPSNIGDRFLARNYYPSKPGITLTQWQNIIDYYDALSPESLPSQNRRESIIAGLPLFTPEKPALQYETPTTSFVKIDNSGDAHHLLVCDAITRNVYRFNKDLALVDSLKAKGPIVDMELQKSSILACNIGVLNPNNGKFGSGEFITFNHKHRMKEDNVPLFENLGRPVQITAVDLNRDGREDYLVCEFGYLMGSLSWMENKGGGKFEHHVLSSLPGAIKAYIRDENHDGLPDIWVLFAHAEEGIFLFTNKGNGQFDQQEILRFPPVYGSSYFEFDDFNHDGFPDILYTCGDNGDFSRILKPYHGVYIFLNDGKDHFTQKYFFPLNGCYKAMARDFDGDGDLDIATIAYFADFGSQPGEGFVYLENKGDFSFQPSTLPEAEEGRWLTMDAGDLNGDGKPDIVLGNFSAGPTLMRSKTNWEKGPPFLVLLNRGK